MATDYLAICNNCKRTFSVDSPALKYKCDKCGGLVVVGNPPIKYSEYAHVNNEKQLAYKAHTLDSWRAPDHVGTAIQKYGIAFEYDTVTLTGESSGGIWKEEINSAIREKAVDGWRLISAYSNELGVNSEVRGVLAPVRENSTVCQHVLIFERRIM